MIHLHGAPPVSVPTHSNTSAPVQGHVWQVCSPLPCRPLQGARLLGACHLGGPKPLPLPARRVDGVSSTLILPHEHAAPACATRWQAGCWHRLPVPCPGPSVPRYREESAQARGGDDQCHGSVPRPV